MRKLFFVGMLVAGLFCSASALLAKEDGTEDCDAIEAERALTEKTPLQKLQEYEQKMGPKILVTERVVLVERTQKGLIFIGDYDVLDKLKAIANVIGDHGVRVVEYRGLENGGVEVFFSIHPAKK